MQLKSNYEKLLEKKRKEFIDNFWLNLGDTTTIRTQNPLRIQTDWQKENPLLSIVDFMRQPENFAFTCQHVFNIKILPFQQIILEQLWKKAFPMLIMTRGGSKTFLLALYSLLKALFFQDS